MLISYAEDMNFVIDEGFSMSWGSFLIAVDDSVGSG